MEGEQECPCSILPTVPISTLGLGFAYTSLGFATLFPQGILQARSAEGPAGLLSLHPLLRHLRLRHREQQEEGGGGGGAGEPRGERLQHGPQHLLLQEPAVRQLDPQGEAAGADPGLSRGAPHPGQMRKLCPKPELRTASIPHKSDLFMGFVSEHFAALSAPYFGRSKAFGFSEPARRSDPDGTIPSSFFYPNTLKILPARSQVPVRGEALQLR